MKHSMYILVSDDIYHDKFKIKKYIYDPSEITMYTKIGSTFECHDIFLTGVTNTMIHL